MQRLAVILAADAVGFSARMFEDREGTVAALDRGRSVFRREVDRAGGRVIDMAGDSVIALFDSAASALSAAVSIQDGLLRETTEDEPGSAMPYRIGLHLGDVLERADGTAYGNGINVAARLQALADPDTIVMSELVAKAMQGQLQQLSIVLRDLGTRTLKNIADAIHVFRVDRLAVDLSARATPRAFSERAAPAKPLLLVMPFAERGGSGVGDYLGEGIAESIASELSRTRWLHVVAVVSGSAAENVQPTSVSKTGGTGPHYVLRGSVSRTADRLRVSAQLTDAPSGIQLWSERFERLMSDVFSLEDEIARRICAEVGLSVPEAEIARAKRKQPHSLDAWDRYLLALHFLRHMTAAAFSRAISELEQALSIEPEFPDAIARLALAYVRAAHFGWAGGGGAAAIEKARGRALASLALDPRNAYALDALASVHLFSGHPDAAASTARRAIEIDPSIASAHGTLVNALAFSGRADEAFAAYAQCGALSPRDPDWSSVVMGHVNALLVAKRYEEVVAESRAHQELRPHWYGSRVTLAIALAMLGQVDQARTAGQAVLELVPHFTLSRARSRPYFKRAEDIETVLTGLRIAGIPNS